MRLKAFFLVCLFCLPASLIYAGLTSHAKTFVSNAVILGFPGSKTVKAMKGLQQDCESLRYGASICNNLGSYVISALLPSTGESTMSSAGCQKYLTRVGTPSVKACDFYIGNLMNFAYAFLDPLRAIAEYDCTQKQGGSIKACLTVSTYIGGSSDKFNSTNSSLCTRLLVYGGGVKNTEATRICNIYFDNNSSSQLPAYEAQNEQSGYAQENNQSNKEAFLSR